ncbi:MAG: GH3 auxin-responsive promoter family protein [Bacteroidia bacterium]
MSIKTFFAKYLAKQRAAYYRKMQNNPFAMQQKVFRELVRTAKDTVFGREHEFVQIVTYLDYQNRVPVRDYEQAKTYFDRIYQGEENVMWMGKPLYLAKTSGTTSGAKYIPITKESIQCQITGAKDTLLMYIHETQNADFLDGKMMFLSGSPELETNEHGMKIGRLSGIVNHFVPKYLQKNRVPTYETNCIEDWESKVKKIVEEVMHEDLRLISGIPPWVQMFFEEAKRQTGKEPLELWKNLQIFVQGGVDFTPYSPIFDSFFQGKVAIGETFPASEGFFAFRDSQQQDDLVLLLDNGVFFEFIPIEEYGKPQATRVTIENVRLNQQYAMIVSTNAGLWAYDIGDTIKFTSLRPFKIKVTGRVKHFISAFGEHVIVEEVNKAMMAACAATSSEIQEFTVAPLISQEKGKSYHEWFVEFLTPPKDIAMFAALIDEEMQKQNVYYKDLRDGNMLLPAKINTIELNASRNFMKAMGKLGGQNKFPRLSNDRKIADWMHQNVAFL